MTPLGPGHGEASEDVGLVARPCHRLARVTDWTVILTGVGTASVTGWFGYLGIRRSTDVTKKQIEETARARE